MGQKFQSLRRMPLEMMRANRGKDTKPELMLRKALHADGLRFRINVKIDVAKRRTVDIAFTKAKFAVFVDGRFWHGCPTHARAVKTNSDYWAQKGIEREILKPMGCMK